VRELIPCRPLSRRGWNQIKLAYKLAGWPAQLATSAFNQLSQYASSPGHRAYCYAELAVSSLAVAVTIASTHFAFPRRDDQAELAWVAWLNTKTVYIPIPIVTRPDVEQLIYYVDPDQRVNHYTKLLPRSIVDEYQSTELHLLHYIITLLIGWNGVQLRPKSITPVSL